jgi:hypothetical protein
VFSEEIAPWEEKHILRLPQRMTIHGRNQETLYEFCGLPRSFTSSIAGLVVKRNELVSRLVQANVRK